MERQGIWCNTKRACHFTRRHSRRASLDKGAIDFKPVFLCKSRQSCYSIYLIHVSTIIEIRDIRQGRERVDGAWP
jgi:hypothetical protein